MLVLKCFKTSHAICSSDMTVFSHAWPGFLDPDMDQIPLVAHGMAKSQPLEEVQWKRCSSTDLDLSVLQVCDSEAEKTRIKTWEGVENSLGV